MHNATSGRYMSRAHDTQFNKGHASAAKVRRMRGGRSRPLGHASSRGSAERVAAKAFDVLEGVASAVHHDVGGDALHVERHERAGRRTERVVRRVSTTARGVASEPAEVASSVEDMPPKMSWQSNLTFVPHVTSNNNTALLTRI